MFNPVNDRLDFIWLKVGIAQAEVWGANSYSSHKSERFPILVMRADSVTMIQ